MENERVVFNVVSFLEGVLKESKGYDIESIEGLDFLNILN